MRRQLLAGAILGLLAAAGVAPLASAHSDHALQWAGRDGEPALREGEAVFGTDFLDLKVELPGSDDVTDWRIEMVHEPSGAVSFCAGGARSDGASTTLQCNWDTKHVGDMSALTPGQSLHNAPPSANGPYIIKAIVGGRDCGLLTGCNSVPREQHETNPFKVTVGNPLSKPTGVNQSYNSETGTIRVTWNANPEPDIARYVVQERFNGGAWVDHDRGLNTTFEKVADPGSYQFQVVAHRPHSQAMPSDPTAAFEVTAPPPPPPGSPGPDLGPEPGVFIPTDDAPATTGTTAGGKTTSTTVKKKTSEQSRGLSGSTLFSRPSPNTVRPSTNPTTVTTIDDGYQEAISYPTTAPKQVEMPGELVAQPKLVTEERPLEPRALLVPLAAGLAVFVFAMQMTVMVRRRPSIATSEDDWA